MSGFAGFELEPVDSAKGRALRSSAARAFSTACRSSTMPVDSGSGFRSQGTSGQADGGSASAEVMAASSCPPCRSTSEE